MPAGIAIQKLLYPIHGTQDYICIFFFLDAPILTAQSATIKEKAESQLRLSCSARSNPVVSGYKWFKGAELLSFDQEELLITSLDVS